MRLKYLSCPIDADKYNITEEELRELPLKDQVQLVAKKMQQFQDQQTAAKEEYDRKAVEAFNEMKKYQNLRSAAKAKADNARENKGRLKKEYNDNLPLIELKIEKAKNDK